MLRLKEKKIKTTHKTTLKYSSSSQNGTKKKFLSQNPNCLQLTHITCSCRFLLNNKLLWGPEKCLISSCRVSKLIWQKQQLNWLESLSPLDITFRCTEHKCLSRWAFCLNIATHSRQANGFSPVWTLRWVLRFQLMPNCLPQYEQRYSLLEPPDELCLPVSFSGGVSSASDLLGGLLSVPGMVRGWF